MTKRGKKGHDAEDASPTVKTLVVRVFWRDRPEPKERCAERLADCLSRLGSISPLFATWKALGRSRSEARKELKLTASALARRLRQSSTDIPREPIPSLGFSFGAWAGDFEGASANISVHCGGYAPTPPNSAVLRVTCEGSWSSVGAPTVRALLDVLVATWHPESGTAGFGLFHELPPPSDLDWMIYRDGRHPPPSMPAPTTVETLPDGRGSIITLAAAAPDLRRPEDARLVENVRRLLLVAAPSTA